MSIHKTELKNISDAANAALATLFFFSHMQLAITFTTCIGSVACQRIACTNTAKYMVRSTRVAPKGMLKKHYSQTQPHVPNVVSFSSRWVKETPDRENGIDKVYGGLEVQITTETQKTLPSSECMNYVTL